MATKAFATIYQNQKTGDCLVQPSVMGKVSWTEFGEPVVIAADRFEDEIVSVVWDCLKKFNQEKFNPDRNRKRTPEENQVFVRTHTSVMVSLTNSGEIVVRPLHREMGGYVGNDGQSIILGVEIGSKELLGAIRKAISLAD